MRSFAIKKIDKYLELDEPLGQLKGFRYVPKVKNKLEVSEMMIVNPEIIYYLVAYGFNKKYKKILELYLFILQKDDDSSEGALMQALDEIARLRSIMIRRYDKFLSKKEIEKFLKKLKILENEIRTKIVDLRLIQEIEIKEEVKEGKSR